MRIEIPESFRETDFERGDYALALMKDDLLLDIRKCGVRGESEMTTDLNTEFLTAVKNDGAKIYEVQFLSSRAFSRSFPMILEAEEEEE